MKMKRKKRCLLKMRKTFLIMVSKLMMTSSAERGCYWFIISIVYLNILRLILCILIVRCYFLATVSLLVVVYTSIAGHLSHSIMQFAFCYPTHSMSRVK